MNVTVDQVQHMFPQTPRRNIEKYLPFILAALTEFDLDSRPFVLMALATIRAESESFEPISEGRSKYNTKPGGRPFGLYDFRRALGNLGPPDGERYKGRGFVQLTGKTNYRLHGENIGVDLLKFPEKANEPETAARLLASFLAAKRDKILAALAGGNLARARQLVNGGSHGLARFTDAYQRGLKAIPEQVVSD